MIKNKPLGYAKKDLKPGEEIKVIIFKDGTMYSPQINFFESITLEDIKTKFKMEVIHEK